jgi:hypothetical protein
VRSTAKSVTSRHDSADSRSALQACAFNRSATCPNPDGQPVSRSGGQAASEASGEPERSQGRGRAQPRHTSPVVSSYD